MDKDNMIEIPRISIIIPVYNGSRYIDGLFIQLSEQEDSRVELIFVDDGSTDDSYVKLKSWQKKVLFQVLVYHQENQGVSTARNVGTALAKGEYIAYIDVDDAVSDDYIVTLLNHAKKEMDVLVFGANRVAEGLECFERHDRREPILRPVSGYEMLVRFWKDPTRLGVYNLLLRAEYERSRGISFPVGYKYYEYYDYLLQAFAQTDRIAVLERVLYFYLLRENSAMARFTVDRITCLTLMMNREKWLEEKKPDFAQMFRKWGVSRLYWSVLWQAALALRRFRDFHEFAEMTHAEHYLKTLKGYPDRLVQGSSSVFQISKWLYWIAVQLTGRKKTKVLAASMEELREKLIQTDLFC